MIYKSETEPPQRNPLIQAIRVISRLEVPPECGTEPIKTIIDLVAATNLELTVFFNLGELDQEFHLCW